MIVKITYAYQRDWRAKSRSDKTHHIHGAMYQVHVKQVYHPQKEVNDKFVFYFAISILNMLKVSKHFLTSYTFFIYKKLDTWPRP